MARWLLGDSFHPGGLKLTSRLAGLMEIGAGSRVLDAGSGIGTSTVHLSKTNGCETVGVTLESEGVTAGVELARQEGVSDLTRFVAGDLQDIDAGAGSFDAAIMECVLSIVPDKRTALERAHSALMPGGKLGLTDVTVKGKLPQELDRLLAVAACVGDALPLEGYRDLATSAGFVVEHLQALPETAQSFLTYLNGKLLLAEVASGLGKLQVPTDLIGEAKRVLAAAQDAVAEGSLGYGMLVARRPE
jgi:ubiquinone/menaquinone biosynthesis C-methylase UbiE